MCDISEDQVKAIYDKTPSCNQFMSWDEVKSFEPMYMILRNAAFAEINGEPVELSAAGKVFYGDKKPELKLVKQLPHEPVEETIKKSTVVVFGKNSVSKLLHALCLAKNCLQSTAVNQTLRDEALKELSEMQGFISRKSR